MLGLKYITSFLPRALCRIQLLPVTHVLVDTWMLTVKPVYKLLNVSDDLKWTTNTHLTPFSLTFKAYLTISTVLEDLLLLLRFFTRPLPFFYPSIFVFTCPNDGWTCLYIKLCFFHSCKPVSTDSVWSQLRRRCCKISNASWIARIVLDWTSTHGIVLKSL